MMAIPAGVLRRNPNYQPSPPVNRTYSGPPIPVSYDQNWQLYNNLTAQQVQWFQSQPEFQNFVAWVALDPPNATIHANAPDMATIEAALTAANVAVAVNPTPLPPQPAPPSRL